MKHTLIFILLLLISCRNENKIENKLDYRINSRIETVFEFPDTVKIGEKNIANLTFYNATFDTIIKPRVKDSIKFRFLLFSEFYPENLLINKHRVFTDSILLDENRIYISYEFDEIGIYRIGGLIRDELLYDYSFLKSDSAFIFKANEVVSKTVVVIK